MHQAYGNTRLARALMWLCVIADVLEFFMMCTASSAGADATGWLWVGAALLVGNGVTAVYAVQQGLPYEWRMQRIWKRTCAGIGGNFVGQGRAKFQPKLRLDPSSSIRDGEWKRQTIYPKFAMYAALEIVLLP